MATAIHSAETCTPDTGTRVQATAGNTSMLRVEASDRDAECAVLVSETNGAGIGSEPREISTIFGSDAVFLPAGTYYINVDVQTNEGTVDVTVQN